MKLGCTIGRKSYSALGYADDLILLAPLRSALQKLVDTSKDYAHDHHIQFNLDKTKCIRFGKPDPTDNPFITLYGKTLGFVNSVEHLGHVLSESLDDSSQIKLLCQEFMAKSNAVKADFNFCSPDFITYLVQVYCCSFYGAVTWNYSSGCINPLNNRFKTMLRFIYKVPYTCHSGIILNMARVVPVHVTVYKRFFRFFRNMQICENAIVNYLGLVASQSVLTLSGKNRAFLSCNYGISSQLYRQGKLGEKRAVHRIASTLTTPDHLGLAEIATELSDAVRGEALIPGFSPDELELFLHDICVN